MTISPGRIIANGGMVIIVLVIIYVFISYIYRSTAGEHVDVNSTTLISDYVKQSDYCDTLVAGNKISSTDIEKLILLNKYDVLTYSDMKEVEQDLNCLSESMSKLLYTGWLIKTSNNASESRIDIDRVIAQSLRTSIILKINGLPYISEETINILEQVDFFKQPFRMQRSLLEDIQ